MVGVAPESMNQAEGDNHWTGWYVYHAGGSKYSSTVTDQPFGEWPKGTPLPDTIVLTLEGSQLFVDANNKRHMVFNDVPRSQPLRLACKFKKQSSCQINWSR